MKPFHRISCLLILFGLFGTAAFVPLGQGAENVRITQIDTSQFPQVTFYVSITDANGEPLAVDASRFVIMENGQQIPPDQIAGIGEVGPVATMLVIDVSGSMGVEGKLESAQAAAHQFIDRLRPIDQAGLISFNTKVEVVQQLTSDTETLDAAIDSLVADDDTAMYDALMVAIKELEGESGRKAIIVLTDGLDNSSTVNINNVTKAIGPEGISISTVGLGITGSQADNMTGIDEPGLQDLATRAGGVYGYAEDPPVRDLCEVHAERICHYLHLPRRPARRRQPLAQRDPRAARRRATGSRRGHPLQPRRPGAGGGRTRRVAFVRCGGAGVGHPGAHPHAASRLGLQTAADDGFRVRGQKRGQNETSRAKALAHQTEVGGFLGAGSPRPSTVLYAHLLGASVDLTLCQFQIPSLQSLFSYLRSSALQPLTQF